MTSRSVCATVLSIVGHVAVLAAVFWLVAPAVRQAPPRLPQIELLPPLPVLPTPQEARPTPINLPVAAQPAPPAPVAPPVPVPMPPPVIQGANLQEAQPAPRKPPPPKPKQKPRLKPQPIRTRAVTRSPAPPAAAPNNGNETKKQTVIAEAPATPQPAGPPPDYIGLIRARLEQVKQYPPEARTEHEEGTVMMRFALDRAGRVLSWRLVRSSGSATLDAEAAAMIVRASPFPPFPQSLDRTTLDLVVPIDFSLRSP